ncbi:MAG: fumarylacetoacetate hydrolase family protein [Fimbriimonadaceae bacterium]|nr:fumarylacetoacetate hydrolase family protein [Fimbriimonadaceae bacterium]
MKLVRFELAGQPGLARSGIFHDNRVYETDGEKAVGIHDPGAYRLLAPIGQAAALRVFHTVTDSGGDRYLTYGHRHPGLVHGPLSEIEMAPDVDGLDFDVHVAAVVQASGMAVEQGEASSFLLGYTLLVSFYVPGVVEDDVMRGGTGAPGRDVGAAMGPFIVTPEEISEYLVSGEQDVYAWPWEVRVEDEVLAGGVVETWPGFSPLVAQSTLVGSVVAGEVLAWPALPKPTLDESSLGRLLLPSERVTFNVEGLGSLVAKVG